MSYTDGNGASRDRWTRASVARGVAAAVGAFLLLGVVTGLLPNPVYERMVPRAPLDYAFLALTAGLLGVYAFQDAALERPGDGWAALGTVGGVLAFGCPVCNAFLLALFSTSTIVAFFDPLRPVLGVLAVGLLGGLVYSRRRACSACE